MGVLQNQQVLRYGRKISANDLLNGADTLFAVRQLLDDTQTGGVGKGFEDFRPRFEAQGIGSGI